MNPILAVYIVGFLVTWLGAGMYWMRRYGGEYREPREEYSAAGWGFLAAMIWPAWLAAFAVIGPMACLLRACDTKRRAAGSPPENSLYSWPWRTFMRPSERR